MRVGGGLEDWRRMEMIVQGSKMCCVLRRFEIVIIVHSITASFPTAAAAAATAAAATDKAVGYGRE